MRALHRLSAMTLVASLLLATSASVASGADAAAEDDTRAVPGTSTGRLITSPPRQVASVAPGQQTSFPMLVQNRLGRTAAIEVVTWDLDPGDAGYASLAEAGTVGRGAGTWLTPDAGRFMLRDGERRTINVTVRVPTTAGPGGHYGAITVTAAREQASDEQIGIDLRIATNVTVVVPGDVSYGGKVSRVRLARAGSGRVRVRFRVAATGNIHTAPTATVTLTGAAGRTSRETIDVPEILPGGSRNVDTRIDAPSPLGPVDAQVRVRFEDRSTDTASSARTLWLLPPTWQLAVAGIVLCALPVVVVAIRRRNLRLLLDRYGEDDDDETEDEPFEP